MGDKPIIPSLSDVIDSYFIQSSLYDHDDDVAGSKSSLEQAEWSDFGERQKGTPARGDRVDKCGRPKKK